jgi:hypothetical protein
LSKVYSTNEILLIVFANPTGILPVCVCTAVCGRKRNRLPATAFVTAFECVALGAPFDHPGQHSRIIYSLSSMRALQLVLALSLIGRSYAAVCCVNSTSGAAFTEACVCLTDGAPVVEAVSVALIRKSMLFFVAMPHEI